MLQIERVVCVGGVHLDSGYVHGIRAAMPAADWRFVDLSGTGRSAEATSQRLDHEVWRADIETALSPTATRQVLVGHSYGGFLAQEFALQYADRLSGLVLCNTAPAFDYPELLAKRLSEVAPPDVQQLVHGALSTPVADDEALQTIWETILPIYFADPDLAGTVTGHRCRARPFNAAYFGCLQAYDVTRELAGLDLPVLAISGSHDWICPAVVSAERIAELAPRCDAVVLDHCGHFPWIERPRAFRDAVGGWVERVAARG